MTFLHHWDAFFMISPRAPRTHECSPGVQTKKCEWKRVKTESCQSHMGIVKTRWTQLPRNKLPSDTIHLLKLKNVFLVCVV